MIHNLPIEILEHCLSFISGCQPANRTILEANSIPELRRQRIDNAIKKYKTAADACYMGDEETTIFMLKNLYYQRKILNEIILHAASKCMVKICTYMLHHSLTTLNPDLNTKQLALKIGSSGYEHIEIFKLAVQFGASDFENMLCPLVECGQLDKFERALTICENFDFRKIAFSAGVSGDVKMVNFVLSKIQDVDENIIQQIKEGATYSTNHDAICGILTKN